LFYKTKTSYIYKAKGVSNIPKWAVVWGTATLVWPWLACWYLLDCSAWGANVGLHGPANSASATAEKRREIEDTYNAGIYTLIKGKPLLAFHSKYD
jgi:hypothetical protein